MKINNVIITNWTPPGKQYWNDVLARPNEPLIEASLSLTLSYNEYQELLTSDRISRGIRIEEPFALKNFRVSTPHKDNGR